MALTETRLDKIIGVGAGTAGRPAFGQTGARWIDTTGPSETFDNGTAWVAIGGGAGGTAVLTVATKTTTYTIVGTDDVILADATGGVFTVSLPTAVGWTKRITIKKIDTSANVVTIGTTGGQTIDGASTRLLNTQFSSVTLVSDNGNWRVSELDMPITTAQALLGAAVSMTNANTYYDGVSVSLAQGTWFIVAGIQVQVGGSATHATAQLWNGTTAVASAQQTQGASWFVEITLSAIVTLGSTTTYKISAACSNTGGSILAAAATNPVGNNTTFITAIRIA